MAQNEFLVGVISDCVTSSGLAPEVVAQQGQQCDSKNMEKLVSSNSTATLQLAPQNAYVGFCDKWLHAYYTVVINCNLLSIS